jgi:hypothetical protein
MNRIKFSEIVKLKKKDLLPKGANVFVEDIVNAMPIDVESKKSVFTDLGNIEAGKWYGLWRVGDSVLTFRHGVCQSAVVKMQLGVSIFDMNIINLKIDFRRDKENE